MEEGLGVGGAGHVSLSVRAMDTEEGRMEVEAGRGHARRQEDGDKKGRLSFSNLHDNSCHVKPKDFPLLQTMFMAYQSLGVVYGDIGTSPLYTFSSVTLPDLQERKLVEMLSLIFWTLTAIPLIKYVCIVLRADDNGEGGTFALYSFLCRHINFRNKLVIQDTKLQSDLNLMFQDKKESGSKTRAKKLLETSTYAQVTLIFVVLLGTCMMIGDGALTPAISVLSAVQGIQSRSSKITQNHVVLLSCAILLVLFLFQRFGTSKVSFSFSPIMLIWFASNSAIGVYNIIKYNPSVLRAVSPHYIYYLFKDNHKKGWEQLGVAFLCVTGAEAMFADLGHFNKRSIQMAFSSLVYPALLLTYAGEAAYLTKNPENLSTTFYSCIPTPLFWPMFVIATLAAIVASQALITASFSIIKQSMALGCFPRVNMMYTSSKHEGQVYSPEVNYLLMIACILITVGFRGGTEISNAYGVAVIWVMLITTCLMVSVMLVIWDTNIILVIVFFIAFIIIEGGIMTSLLNKVPQGGWVPFGISAFFLIIMLAWTYGRSKKNEYEAERKMSKSSLIELMSSNEVSRVPGICFFCTNLASGIPPIIAHYVQHVTSLRELMVILSVQTLPTKSVLPKDRFLVASLGVQGVYRCLVQYGYKDVPSMEGDEFVHTIIQKIKEQAEAPEEVQLLESAARRGVVFVTGRIILKSKDSNGWLSRIAIDKLYRFLQKNSRSSVSTLGVPPSKMLQVGMLYEI